MAKKKGKQGHLPGLEPPSYPEIDEAAEEYRGIRDRRMDLTAKEAEANEKLLGLMKDRSLLSYTYDEDGTPYEVLCKEVEKASVRKKKEPKANGE